MFEESEQAISWLLFENKESFINNIILGNFAVFLGGFFLYLVSIALV